MTAAAAAPTEGLAPLLAAVRTESGSRLLDLAAASPVLLLFLRHFGCSFCRRTISDIAQLTPELARRGVQPVFVHLGPCEIARAHFDYYGLGSVERIHDPTASLYRHPAFAVPRKSLLGQVLNPRVWVGWLNGTVFRHGIGTIQGDGQQMPALFLLNGPAILRRYHYRTIADQPDYLKLVG
jgi:hypothetical protein